MLSASNVSKRVTTLLAALIKLENLLLELNPLSVVASAVAMTIQVITAPKGV